MIEKVEKVKDMVEELQVDADTKRKLFVELNAVRSEIYRIDRLLAESVSRTNVYAEICNKMLDRLVDKHY